MNPSETNNAITVLVALAGPYLVQVGLTPGLLANALTGIVGLAAFGWALYSHWNMRKVPENATITSPIPAKAFAQAIAVLAVALVGLIAIGQPGAHAATLKTTPAATSGSVFTQINALFNSAEKFTAADFQAAFTDANSQTPPDTRHAGCWQAMIPVAQAGIGNPLPSGLGLAQAIQKVFDDQRLFGQQPWKDAVATACALTVLDLGTDLNTLLAKVGVATVAIPKL
jgi:hypothetical protein